MRDEMNFSFCLNEDYEKTIATKSSADNKGITNISNGYYGYQPIQKKESEEKYESMEVQTCDSNIQFNNMIEDENLSENRCTIPPSTNRKRSWEYRKDGHDLKKRRESEPIPHIPQIFTSSVRHPTHNVPDMPRCIMERLIVTDKTSPKEDILEELLLQTHGCSVYHWKGVEVL